MIINIIAKRKRKLKRPVMSLLSHARHLNNNKTLGHLRQSTVTTSMLSSDSLNIHVISQCESDSWDKQFTVYIISSGGAMPLNLAENQFWF